jgi:hypothetical protein
MHAPFDRIRAGRQPAIPDTAIADAFLKALVRLVAARHSRKTKIVLPTGIVDAGELEPVLRGLGLIDRRAP